MLDAKQIAMDLATAYAKKLPTVGMTAQQTFGLFQSDLHAACFVNEKVHKFEKKKGQLSTEYLRASGEVDEEIRKIQARCKHLLQKHYPDASGGSDSWDECEICGKQW